MISVPKRWEYSYLRRPRDNEELCENGKVCAGLFIQNQSGEPRFILPQFKPPESDSTYKGLCLICARERVFTEYLLAIHRDRGAAGIIQPWCNNFDDYDAAYYLIPIRDNMLDSAPFVGIIRPFFRCSISKYYINAKGNIRIRFPRFAGERLRYYTESSPCVIDLLYNEQLSDFFPDSTYLMYSSLLITPKSKSPRYEVFLLNKALTTKSPLLEDEQGRDSDWFMKLKRASIVGIYPWSSVKLDESKEVFDRVLSIPIFNTLVLRECVVFLVEDDPTLLGFIRVIHPNWDRFSSETKLKMNKIRVSLSDGSYDPSCSVFTLGNTVLKAQCVDFWDRMYEKNRNKLFPVPDDDEVLALDIPGITKICRELIKVYNQSPLNAKLPRGYDSIINNLLTLRRRRWANRQIPLPANLQTKSSLLFYLCPACETVKAHTRISTLAAYHRRKKKKKNKYQPLKQQGSDDVCYNATRQTIRCHRTRVGGRKAVYKFYSKPNQTTLYHCNENLVPCHFGRNIVHSKGQALVTCRKCEFICHLTANWIYTSGLCPDCSIYRKEKIQCHSCASVRNEKSKSANWFYVPVLQDGGRKPPKLIWYCGKHSFYSSLKGSMIWSPYNLKQALSIAG